MKYKLGNLISYKEGYSFYKEPHAQRYISNNNVMPVINARNFSNGTINHNYTGNTCIPNYLSNKYSEYILKPGDILMSTRGTIGRIAKFSYRHIKCLLNQHILRLRSNTNILNNKYLYWLLNSSHFHRYLLHTSKGSVQKLITLKSIFNYIVELPSINIQNKQSKLLDNINNKFILNKQVSKHLVKLLNLYFTKISNTSYQKNNKNIVVNLGSIANSVKNRAKKRHLIYNPYIPINKIPKHQLFSSDYESNSKARSSLIYFKKNDILFGAMRPYFHRLMIAPFNGITRTTTIVIRPNEAKELPFLAMRLFQDDFIKYAYSNCKGSTMPYDTWDTIKDFKFLMPSHLTKFNKIFTTIRSYINNLNLENLKLFRLRHLLLLKFFN